MSDKSIRLQGMANLDALVNAVHRLKSRLDEHSQHLGDRTIMWNYIAKDVEMASMERHYYAQVGVLGAAAATFLPMVDKIVPVSPTLDGAVGGIAASTMFSFLTGTYRGVVDWMGQHTLDKRIQDNLLNIRKGGPSDSSPSDPGLLDAEIKKKLDEGMRQVSRFQSIMESASRVSPVKEEMERAGKFPEPHGYMSMAKSNSHKIEVAVNNMQKRAEEAISHGVDCLNMLQMAHTPVLRAKWGGELLQTLDNAAHQARFVPSKSNPGKSMAEDFENLRRQLIAIVPDAAPAATARPGISPPPPRSKGPR